MAGNLPGAKKRLQRRMTLQSMRQRTLVVTFDDLATAEEWERILERNPREALRLLADMSIHVAIPGKEG
jgi:hypothetical protein